MRGDELIDRVLNAWLHGDSNEIYPAFLRLLNERAVEDVLQLLPEDLRSHLVLWMAENVEELSPTLREWVLSRMDETYREAVRRTGADVLHEVLVGQGPSILARDLPYIVRACRWKAFDRIRREQRGRTINRDEADVETAATAFERLAEDERLLALRDELAQLANVDVMILWRTAEGVADAAIAQALGLSAEAVRQRRHRSVRRLKAKLGVVSEG